MSENLNGSGGTPVSTWFVQKSTHFARIAGIVTSSRLTQ